jgi:holo-[acyl-carrier protein] synthase
MIVGIGTDLVDIPRIAAFADRWGDGGLRRIFSEAELAYCLALSDPAPSLAARFAAKEAFFKAVGTGFGVGGDWREVEVLRDPRGAPSLRIRGRAEKGARDAGVRSMHLSLSHTDETAGAVVVLEG